MRSKSILFAVAALALSFSAPTFAKDAKPLPTIEATGIGEFNPTFMKAKAIHDTLDEVKTKLATSNKSLATALALPETTSLDQALSELKTKAAGKIKVAMNGNMPKLTASDAVPPEIQTAIDAVNQMVDDLGGSLNKMKELPGEATAVVAGVKDFPSQLNPDLLAKNNLKASDLMGVTKKLNNDMKAVASTPQRLTDVTNEITSLMSKIQATFSS